MVKECLIILAVATPSVAKSYELLQQNCLECHIREKIPSELIYRRYLLKYSTHKAIKSKLIQYLKNPTTETSIMPKQFFLKFPQKRVLDLKEEILKQSIDEYLDYFDIRGKLELP
jgi:hypothetical protein